MAADASPTVFKTVCGALLRRPGWVRFPSIPAKSRLDDSQDDSHNRELDFHLRHLRDQQVQVLRGWPRGTALAKKSASLRTSCLLVRHRPQAAALAPPLCGSGRLVYGDLISECRK